MSEIVVVGEAGWDQVLCVPRLPSADPQTVTVTDSWRTVGGSGAITAAAIAQLGQRVTLIAPVGTDDAGQRLHDRLGQAGVTVVDLARERARTSVVIGDAQGYQVEYASVTGDVVLDDAAIAALGAATEVVVGPQPWASDAVRHINGEARLWWQGDAWDGLSTDVQDVVERAGVIVVSDENIEDPVDLDDAVGADRVIVVTHGIQGVTTFVPADRPGYLGLGQARSGHGVREHLIAHALHHTLDAVAWPSALSDAVIAAGRRAAGPH